MRLSRPRRPRGAFLLAALPAILVAGALAACGDDGAATASTTATSTTASGSNQDGPPAPVSDKAYVKSVCSSFNTYFEQAIDAATKDPTLINDPQKLAKAVAPAIKKFADDMAKLRVPDGVQSYHGQVVKQLRQVVDQANSGQIKSLADLADVAGSVRPDQALGERLAAAAKDVPECQSEIGGGLFNSVTAASTR
ncbi:MAG: hypothetical protein IT304_03290 [Dehalococcoidia bacterium]|nr:hypothetical protein [Dehalococcoidia bacterium]